MSCGNGLPMGVALTPAQAGETAGLGAALGSVSAPRPGRGRPRQRPAAVAGDRGYDHPSVRRRLARRGMRVVIAPRRPHPRHRPKRGRPFGFDRGLYRRRNAIGRCVGRLKEHRRLGTRYEKLAVSYLAVAHVCMIRLYLRRITDLSDRT